MLFLPGYSPDPSIEETYSKLKTFLRQVGARTREARQASHLPGLAHHHGEGVCVGGFATAAMFLLEKAVMANSLLWHTSV